MKRFVSIMSVVIIILSISCLHAFAEEEEKVPIIRAAIHGDYDFIKKLILEENADVDEANEAGITALMTAAKMGHLEIVKLLLKNGADIDAENEKGFTALNFAINTKESFSQDSSKAYDILKIILDKSAVRFIEDSVTLLGVKDVKAIELLLEKGVDINAIDTNGNSALIKAAHDGDIERVRLLIKKGADADIESNMGMTALSIAEMQGYTDIADLLK